MNARAKLRDRLAGAVDVNDQLAAIAAERREQHDDSAVASCRLAILTGYTSRLLGELVYGHALVRGLRIEIKESGYGLFEQVILAEDPEFVAFEPEVVYFCVGFEHLVLDSVDEELARWRRLWEKARALYGCDIVMNNVVEPRQRVFGNHELKVEDSIGRKVAELNLALAREAPPYVHLHDVNFLASNLGKDQMFDPKWYAVAKLPASLSCLPAYAVSLASVICAARGRSKKCAVLDLDNTLWGGVIGDDGVDGIRLGADSPEGESFVRFQRYLKALADRGVLLAICSKNDEAIARAPFERRSEMALELRDVSAFVANWAPKDEGIRHIAATLNIHLDSMVFIDDSATECALVRARLPEVTVVELPADPARYCEAVAAGAFFEPIALSSEDRLRTASFQAEGQRVVLQESVGTYEDYLAALEMQATLRAWRPDEVPRVTQLLAKTNQFNLTGRRYPDSRLRTLAEDPTGLCRRLSLRDRFGDYGLVSVFVATVRDEVCEIENWVMSCRVFKRGVEAFLFGHVCEDLVRRGVRTVLGRLLPTDRNGYVAELFPSLGFARRAADHDREQLWQLALPARSDELPRIATHIRRTQERDDE